MCNVATSIKLRQKLSFCHFGCTKVVLRIIRLTFLCASSTPPPPEYLWKDRVGLCLQSKAIFKSKTIHFATCLRHGAILYNSVFSVSNFIAHTAADLWWILTFSVASDVELLSPNILCPNSDDRNEIEKLWANVKLNLPRKAREPGAEALGGVGWGGKKSLTPA